MINELKQETENRMRKSIKTLQNDLTKLRTGRAHPSLIEHIKISYYGNEVPLSQAASITVSDARTLAVSPWEKAIVPDIEKAIRNADLGLNPVTAGQLIRIPLPALTEERRRDLVKLVRQQGEETRVAVRNVRRDAISQLKELLKEKAISEDDEKRGQDVIQKVTDKIIEEIDALIATKESEVMEV